MMMKPSLHGRAWPLLGLLGLLFAGPAQAVGTRSFVLDSADSLSGGKLEGTAVESTGVVLRGVQSERTALEGVSVARCILTQKDGTTLIGTATDGKIYRFDGKQVSPFAETGQLMVTALAQGPKGEVLAATLPNGLVFRIDEKGKASVFATLPGAEHVWALVVDKKRGAVYAATGPEGKIFRINSAGKVAVHLDTEAEHVMALAIDARGTLYAGTSDEALLLRVPAPNKAEVVYDFEGNEVTSIAIRDGVLAVAANHFPKPKANRKPPQVPAIKASTDSSDSDDKAGSNNNNRPNQLPTPSKPGKGQLWRIEASGRARTVFDSPKGHITAVEFASDGAIFAAIGHDGQVYRVREDGEESLWIDVDERQVLALDLTGPHPRFATGDGAALYTVKSDAKNEGFWLSKPLDAVFQARWGELSFRGTGKLTFQTRSGNTEKPDDSWSEWSSPLTHAGPIRSAPGRFLQLRAKLERDAALFAVMAHYLPRNQPPTITSVSAAPKTGPKPRKGNAPDPKPTSEYQVKWTAANPDGDSLRYRVWYKPETAQRFRPLLHEDQVLTDSHLDWDTDNVPDGFYVLRVEASDELDNPDGRQETHVRVSEPVLIDNHAPEFSELKVAGGRLTGSVRDAQGPLRELRYRIDQDNWKPLYPVDDMLDTNEERFTLTLPQLPAGPHVIAVRAVDARHNSGSAELEFDAK